MIYIKDTVERDVKRFRGMTGTLISKTCYAPNKFSYTVSFTNIGNVDFFDDEVETVEQRYERNVNIAEDYLKSFGYYKEHPEFMRIRGLFMSRGKI